ncbi:hypothetical protein NUM_00490 [Actinocatenispora comari]|uniref:Uncharacterized protein n=1 Tax=Actinocatenispora comari TaxID=2807577 RepID=A0A8J4A4F4_9ACTN|nr:hypothetical protein NUM_00490 [Actinocatenispora comari]
MSRTFSRRSAREALFRRRLLTARQPRRLRRVTRNRHTVRDRPIAYRDAATAVRNAPTTPAGARAGGRQRPCTVEAQPVGKPSPRKAQPVRRPARQKAQPRKAGPAEGPAPEAQPVRRPGPSEGPAPKGPVRRKARRRTARRRYVRRRGGRRC